MLLKKKNNHPWPVEFIFLSMSERDLNSPCRRLDAMPNELMIKTRDLKRLLPVFPSCTGCTSCPASLCSKLRVSPGFKYERHRSEIQTVSTCKSRLAVRYCALRTNRFDLFIRVQAGFPISCEVAEHLEGIFIAALIWVNPIFT